ncbi:MAG: hypothetical protein ACLQU2_20770, partial [Candidatus Binataceae bacterium]
SAGHQVVAHKSTGGILNSFPEPVDPVGNASDRLTNNTVALPGQEEGINRIFASRSSQDTSALDFQAAKQFFDSLLLGGDSQDKER